MKKLLSVIISILIITAMFTQIALAEETSNIKFTDLDETYWAYENIQKLVAAGYIVGYPDGTFKPDGNITRAELVKIANLVFSYVEKQDITEFTDIKLDDWFYENVLIAQKAGYITGYPDKTFKPNGMITRQELCKVLDSINNFVELPYTNATVDVVDSWAMVYVNKVLSNRIMILDENNNFRATEKATRAEVCDALAKFLIVEEPDTDTTSGGGSTGTPSADENVDETMNTVARRLEKGVIPNLTSEAQKEIVNDIISNMKTYEADSSHDYESAAESTYNKYKKLSVKEKEDLIYQIQLNNTTKDLLELKDFFFPDVDIK